MTAHVLRKPHLDLLAVVLLLGCCMLWGLQQVLVKATLVEVAPVFQAAIRFAGATLLLALWCRWRGVALWQRDGSWWPGLLAGSLFAIEFCCLYVGLQFTTASRLTVFLYTAPFWVAMLLPLRLPAERLHARQWLGLWLAFGAVLFALGDGLLRTADAAQQWLGDLLALVAGLAWALTTVTIRSSRLIRLAPEKLLFYQLGVSMLVTPLLSLLLGESWNWSFSAFAVASLLLQTVVVAFASYLLWMWMLGRYPTTPLNVFVFLTPMFALLLGAWWLREPVTLSLTAALVMAFVGIVLVNWRKPA